MSDDMRTYPIAVIEDRYGGTYSGGKWIAVADFYASCGDALRSRLGVVVDGAHGDDLTAAEFGGEKPEWCAVGNTPDEAIANLRAKVSR